MSMLNEMNFRIRNATSERTGKAIPNQFFGWHGDTEFFQSYDTPIIEVDHENFEIKVNVGIVSLGHTSGRAYHVSRTTSKYLKVFLLEAFGDAGNYIFKNFDKLIDKGEVTVQNGMITRHFTIIKVNE